MIGRWILIGSLWLVVLVLFFQHQTVMVPFVWFNQGIPSLSLGLLLLGAYGSGLLLGGLFVVAWYIRDALRQKKTQRQFDRLTERVALIESQLNYAPTNLQTVQWSEADREL